MAGDKKLTAKEQFGGAESARREDDATALVQADSATEATISEALKLDTRDLAAAADGPPDGSVGPQVEVAALGSRSKVGSQGTTTLPTREHELGVRIGAVLLRRCLIGADLLVAGSGKTAGDDLEALLAVALAILRRGRGAGDALKDTVGGAGEIVCLPALREVVVPVRGVGLR